MNSDGFYDQIDYSEYYASAHKYLSSIDRLIIRYAPDNIDSYLDVGAGDGVRASKLCKVLRPHRTVLVDRNHGMFEKCKQLDIGECHQSNIVDFDIDCKFDVITCLWSVLGHLDSQKERQAALNKMKSLLSEQGILFLDLNNRYNIAQYGLLSVIKNIFRGGWFPLNDSSSVYVHSFWESKALVKKSGLQVMNLFYVNYTSGKLEKYPWSGQTFFILQ
jgi:2-polyprenyl-3-methyl-5-hydroxy-6-metoxy-1,4-benzoquinol methylase